LEFHVHIDTSQIAIGVILAQNPINKFDQLIIIHLDYWILLFKNNTTIERKVLAMVYALHKFRHYLLNNMFIFYVNHMALTFLVNKP
jgi:hypothetical protein